MPVCIELYGINSCGNSSGFAPDSLFTSTPKCVSTNSVTNVINRWGNSKKNKSNIPQKNKHPRRGCIVFMIEDFIENERVSGKRHRATRLKLVVPNNYQLSIFNYQLFSYICTIKNQLCGNSEIK